MKNRNSIFPQKFHPDCPVSNRNNLVQYLKISDPEKPVSFGPLFFIAKDEWIVPDGRDC